MKKKDKLLLACGKECADRANLPLCVMDDEGILEEAHAYLSPHDLYWGRENGELTGGLWSVARDIRAAMEDEWLSDTVNTLLQTGNLRGEILFALYAAHLLGVQRGLEVYRRWVIDEDGGGAFDNIPFTMENLAAQCFLESVVEEPAAVLDEVLALVGIHVSESDKAAAAAAEISAAEAAAQRKGRKPGKAAEV